MFEKPSFCFVIASVRGHRFRPFFNVFVDSERVIAVGRMVAVVVFVKEGDRKKSFNTPFSLKNREEVNFVSSPQYFQQPIDIPPITRIHPSSSDINIKRPSSELSLDNKDWNLFW